MKIAPFHAAFCLAFALGFVPASAWADHAHHSSAAEVLAALKGATVEGETAEGVTYRIVYGAVESDSGTAVMQLGDRTETGTWSVDSGGHYCETWPGLHDGKRRCGGIEVTGGLLILRGAFATTRTAISPASGN